MTIVSAAWHRSGEVELTTFLALQVKQLFAIFDLRLGLGLGLAEVVVLVFALGMTPLEWERERRRGKMRNFIL
jgi:hypothetical protein